MEPNEKRAASEIGGSLEEKRKLAAKFSPFISEVQLVDCMIDLARAYDSDELHGWLVYREVLENEDRKRKTFIRPVRTLFSVLRIQTENLRRRISDE